MVDLTLDMDISRGRRAGLEDALRRAVASAQLAPGVRLPSSRALAGELGWARATVVAAYEQLVAEGYLVSRHGAGTAVAAVPRPQAATAGRRRPPSGRRRPAIDLRPGEPDRSSFPRRQWLASVRHVLSAAPDEIFGYGDPRGLRVLREALATYLGRSRAVIADPDDIVVFAGFAGALAVLAAVLEQLGVRRVGVEDPGLTFHGALLADAGQEVVPVPVDGLGIDVDGLGASSCGVALVTPAHQYPTGVPLSAGRRQRLVEWARDEDALVIEDDYDGEFRYDRHPLGALQGLDPEHVVYGGTASKSLAAGLRVAWLVLPPSLRDAVVEARRWKAEVPTVEQATLAHFIESGRLDRHLRHMRSVYRRRRDALAATLATTAPWMPFEGISAGLHATARLPEGGPGEDELVNMAAERSIALMGLGPHHYTAGTHPPGLVIGYSRPPDHGFPTALERLAGLLRAASP